MGNISRNNYFFFQNGSLQYIYYTMFNNWFHYQRNTKWNFLLTNKPLKYKNIFVNLSFRLKVCHTNMTLMKNPFKISECNYMYVTNLLFKMKRTCLFSSPVISVMTLPLQFLYHLLQKDSFGFPSQSSTLILALASFASLSFTY